MDPESPSRLSVTVDPREYLQQTFVPHGRYVASLENGLLRSELTGPFNLEMMKIYVAKTATIFQAAEARGNWVAVSVFRESMLASLDIMELLASTLAERTRIGWHQLAAAHVADASVEGREIMGRLYRDKVFAPNNIPYQLFLDEAAARNWVSGYLKI